MFCCAIMKFLLFLIIQFVYVSSGTIPIDGCNHGCQAEENCIAFVFNKMCYYIFNKDITSWDGNNKLCEDKALSMVKVLEDMINSQFSEKLLGRDLGSHANVWLGGKVQDYDQWTYVKGVPIDKTTSPELTMDSGYQEMQLCITVQNGSKLFQEDCRNMHNFVCRFDDWHGIPSVYVSEIPASWYIGRSRCLDMKGDLFYLKEGENFNSFNLYTKTSPYPGRKMFIGLTKRMWMWEGDGQIQYFNWQDKEPNIFSEECLSMLRKEGTWSDVNCQTEMPAFCQGAYTSDILKETPTDSTGGNTGGLIALGVVVVICLLVIAVLVLLLLQQKGIISLPKPFPKGDGKPSASNQIIEDGETTGNRKLEANDLASTDHTVTKEDQKKSGNYPANTKANESETQKLLREKAKPEEDKKMEQQSSETLEKNDKDNPQASGNEPELSLFQRASNWFSEKLSSFGGNAENDENKNKQQQPPESSDEKDETK